MRCLMSIAVLLSPITVACKTVETIETAVDSMPSSATIPNLPKQTGLPVAPNGRNYPLVPKEPSDIAALLAGIEAALITPQLAEQDLAALAHQQQVVYRVLSKRPRLSENVRSQIDPRWRWVFDQHIAARREFLAMHRGPASSALPAWRIQSPESAEQLLLSLIHI